MELDFRKLNVTKLFDFSKEQEMLIFEIYDQLFNIYDLSVLPPEDSFFQKFNSDNKNSLFTPKICYFITDKNKENPFRLFIVSKIGTTIKGARAVTSYDSLQVWGMKTLQEDFGFISINKKKWTDRIASIFSRSNTIFKDGDFTDFYVLGSDPLKARAFLNTNRKNTIKSFPAKDFRLEIKNNLLYFALPKNLSVNNTLITAKFLEQI